jgi:hypothetical protein
MITYSKIGTNGRLGNQLFQYAAAKALSIHLGTELLLPPENDNNNLSFFKGIKFQTNSRKEWNEYKEPHFHYDPHFWELKNDTDIFGYFQSEKYFAPYKNTIREDLILGQTINSFVLEYLLKISTPTVSIHIRKGDYVNNSYYTQLDKTYYTEAINYLALKIGHFSCVVSSDDIKWCKENFNIDNAIYTTYSTILDFAIMKACDHNIIANSSFSWWAAWLNSNQQKIVIAPNKWFGAGVDLNTKDLLPNEWIKI